MQIIQSLKEKQDFYPTEIQLANYLLDKGLDIEKVSARKIAKECYMAPSTVTRFCQKLGFQGYNDFKEAYLKELHYASTNFQDIDANYPFSENDKNTVIAHKIGHLYHECIDDVLNLMHHDELQKAITLLIKAQTICIVSSGVQSDVAQTFKDKLLKIGKTVIIEKQMDQAFYHASFCNDTWVFIVISYSGETEITLRVAKQIHERGLPLIALCSYGQNTLAKIANVVLYVSTREKLVENQGSFSMSVSTMLILDILYAGIFNENARRNLASKVKTTHEFEIYRYSENEVLKDE